MAFKSILSQIFSYLNPSLRAPLGFLDFPAEIRNQIYSYLTPPPLPGLGYIDNAPLGPYKLRELRLRMCPVTFDGLYYTTDLSESTHQVYSQFYAKKSSKTLDWDAPLPNPPPGYDYVEYRMGPVKLPRRRWKDFAKLLLLNRQVYQETVGIMYSGNTFVIHPRWRWPFSDVHLRHPIKCPLAISSMKRFYVHIEHHWSPESYSLPFGKHPRSDLFEYSLDGIEDLYITCSTSSKWQKKKKPDESDLGYLESFENFRGLKKVLIQNHGGEYLDIYKAWLEQVVQSPPGSVFKPFDYSGTEPFLLRSIDQ